MTQGVLRKISVRDVNMISIHSCGCTSKTRGSHETYEAYEELQEASQRLSSTTTSSISIPILPACIISHLLPLSLDSPKESAEAQDLASPHG